MNYKTTPLYIEGRKQLQRGIIQLIIGAILITIGIILLGR